MVNIIQAVLGGKSLGYEYSEDILTSTIFGMLKYIDKNNALIPFIESAFQYDEKRTTLWERLKSDGIELRCYREVKYVFWATNYTYGEPDLLLLFSNHIHGHENLLLIVEAKFKSGKSGVNENDQLARYFEAVSKDIDNFSDACISNFKGKKEYLIYLTEAASHSDILASSQVIQSKHPDIKDAIIFHLRWHQLYKIFQMMYPFYLSYEKMMVDDLMNYLEKIGLRDFSGISLPEQSLNLVFNSPDNIFYADKTIVSDTYFDLPDIDWNYNQFILYEGV